MAICLPINSVLMIRRLLFTCWLIIGCLSIGLAQRQCATTAYDLLLQRRHPGWAQSRAKLETLIQQKQVDWQHFRLEEEETIRIPVVVHVVHHDLRNMNNPGAAGSGNISDAQIQSQIEVLNEDYRRKPGTNGFNDNPVGADVNIEFYLATRDPDGHPSNGITRTYDTTQAFDVFNDDERLKSLVDWPSNRYLNIWVTSVASPYIGYTQFPDGSGLAGLDETYGTDKTDGTVISHRVFGRRIGTANSSSSVYRDGRTTTHEIGHWLGLLHTWGDYVCGDDHCGDTPPTRDSNQTRDESCEAVYSTCSGTRTRNMIENYLDYSPDICMNIFTKDQKVRMRKVLEVSPRRAQLVQYSRTLPESEQLVVKIYPNPVKDDAKDVTNVEVLLKGSQAVTIRVYDAAGRTLVTQDYPPNSSESLGFSNVGLHTGLYYVMVTTSSGEKAVKRLAVIR